MKNFLFWKLFKRKTKNILFSLYASQAKNVFLVGDFNHWDNTGLQMYKDEAGTWKVVVKLCAGRYEYKFVVDNEWKIDPANNEIIKNSFGASNSVIKVII